jgi:hypothetical protein
MSKRLIITEEEKSKIKSLYNLNEQASEGLKSLADTILNAIKTKNFKGNSDQDDEESSSLLNDFSSNISSDDDFYKSILKCIGAKPTKTNLMFMYAWRQAEGGSAKNNPFNTTLKWNNATNYNSVGVKNYQTPEDGIQATCKTLQHSRYNNIVQGFKNDVGLSNLANAVTNSKWGTGNLLKRITNDYIAGISPKPKDIA